jgi:hypothetical protein
MKKILMKTLLIKRCLPTTAIFLTASCWSQTAAADGAVVDKVYHPYVLPFEREVEWRLMSRQSDDGNQLAQRIGYGFSLSETLMIEAYIIGQRDQDSDFDLSGYEIEARWMLTQQGQYWADWGLLFEFEKQHNTNDFEIASGLLFEKEFGQTSLTLNGFIIYEWGHTVASEVETEIRMQYRYRWLPEIQPAIEFYQGEDYTGIGPAFMGTHRIDRQKQFKWEASFITGLNGNSKDHTFRLAIEYEF